VLNAAYAKSYDTLESLYKGCDAIAIGTAGDIVEERQFGVAVEFAVEESIKGTPRNHRRFADEGGKTV
jgi:hypothetical protein